MTSLDMEHSLSPSPSPFRTFDAMSLAPVHDSPQLTISPAQTSLAFSESGSVPPESPEEDTKQDQKKPVKKRKSWGQELPTPKTNLPPRKRAKTEDEKEQRRIERVLRNRAAAQTSRERKRLEVEKLENEKLAMERQNEFLLKRLAQMEAENNRLSQQVAQLSSEIRSSRGASPGSNAGSCGVVDTTTTLSPILFKHEPSDFPSLDRIPFPSPSISAVSPAHLDVADLPDASDLTQHPAAVLCADDLQCQSEPSTTGPAPSWLEPTTMGPRTTMMIASTAALQTITFMHHLLFLTMTSAVSSTLIAPLSQIFLSLKTGCPLTFSRPDVTASRLLPLILWLISTPNLSSTTTATTTTHPHLPPTKTSSTTTTTASSPRSSVFRIRLLTRLLECSPALARPLRDATSRALQLAAGEMVLVPGSSTSSTTQPCGSDGSGPGGKESGGVVDVDVVGSGMRDWALLTTVIWAIDRHILLQNKKEKKMSKSLPSPKRSRRLSGERAKQKLAPKMRSRVVDY